MKQILTALLLIIPLSGFALESAKPKIIPPKPGVYLLVEHSVSNVSMIKGPRVFRTEIEETENERYRIRLASDEGYTPWTDFEIFDDCFLFQLRYKFMTEGEDGQKRENFILWTYTAANEAWGTEKKKFTGKYIHINSPYQETWSGHGEIDDAYITEGRFTLIEWPNDGRKSEPVGAINSEAAASPR